MSMTIPKKYLKGEDNTALWPLYIIAPPEGVPQLTGYVMKQLQDFTQVSDSSLLFSNGNEWNKTTRQYLYMFEREEKVPGHPSKRYRYTEEELIRAYGMAGSATYEERLDKRIQNATKGPGRLVRASYTEYYEGRKETAEGWYIVPDGDETWVYSFDYDPLRNQGKHSQKAAGFSIMEEYQVRDITLLREHLEVLTLLKKLDSIRAADLGKVGMTYTYDRFGDTVDAISPADEIAFIAYEKYIPAVMRYDTIDGKRCEMPDAEAVRLQLMAKAAEIEDICHEYINAYKAKKLADLIREIKEITGIDMSRLINKYG